MQNTVPMLHLFSLLFLPHVFSFPANETFTLHNGLEMPVIGLGCASGVRKHHVSGALENGYRFFDTAQAYVWGYQEHEVGAAWDESKYVERGDVWLQSKLHPRDLGKEETLRAFKRSLENLRTDYVDSFLIHFPRCHDCDVPPKGTWRDTWPAFEQLYDKKKVRAIGVSNFDHLLLERLVNMAKIKPHFIQNWMDPYHQDRAARLYAQENGIVYQAYSQFGGQWQHRRAVNGNPIMRDETLKDISVKHQKNVGQIVLRWLFQLGVQTIPAARKQIHQASNIDIFDFELDAEDMKRIEELDGTVPGEEKTNEDAVAVTFKNPYDREYDLFWMNSGTEVPQGKLTAHSTMTINSFYGHRFRVRHGYRKVVDWHIEKRNGKTQLMVLSDEEGSKGELR